MNARPNTTFMSNTTSPLTPTAISPVPASFQPARTRSPRMAAGVLPLMKPAGRDACARTTAVTDPNAEIAASCASCSVIPAASPQAAVSRR